MTTADAAALLGVHRQTVLKYVRRMMDKHGRDYVLSDADVEAIRRAMAEAKPGRPRQ